MALKINRRLHKILSIVGWVLLIIVVVVLVKILIWESNYYSEMNTTPRSATVSVITNIEPISEVITTEPSEEELANHNAADEEPLYLNIPRLDVHARVLISQADNEGKLPVAENIHDTMWYSGSAMPGKNGATIITGQSGDDENEGVFAGLEVLEKGDKIQVVLGNGYEEDYEVAEIYIVNEADLYQKLYLTQQKLDDKPTLSLVTANTPSENKSYNSVTFIRAIRKD